MIDSLQLSILFLIPLISGTIFYTILLPMLCTFHYLFFKVSKLQVPVKPFYTSISFILYSALYSLLLLYLSTTKLPNPKNDAEFPRYAILALNNFAILPFLSTKYGPLFWLGARFVDLIALHSLYATGGIIMACLHGGLYINEWMTSNVLELAFSPEIPFGADPTLGLAGASILVLLFLTSIPPFTIYFYRAFKFIHLAAMPCIFFLFYLHSPRTLPYLLPGMILIFIDGMSRLVTLLTPLNAVQIDKDASNDRVLRVKVRLATTLDQLPLPGQWFLVYSPFYGLHPLSCISATRNTVSFAICKNTRLARRIATCSISSIDGPYGCSFNGLLDSSSIFSSASTTTSSVKAGPLLLIAGGIGLTPLISLAASSPTPQAVTLILIAPTRALVDAFATEIQDLMEKGVQVQIYLTKQQECIDASLTTTTSSSSLEMEEEESGGQDHQSSIEKGKESLYSLVSLGRPRLYTFIREWGASQVPRDHHESTLHLNIGVCGPRDLIFNVANVARVESGKGVFLHVYSEQFN